MATCLTADGKAVPSRPSDSQWEQVNDMRNETDGDNVWRETGAKTAKLHAAWERWKDAMITEDELDATFELLEQHPNLVDLPAEYRETEEWARLWAAYALQWVLLFHKASTQLSRSQLYLRQVPRCRRHFAHDQVFPFSSTVWVI